MKRTVGLGAGGHAKNLVEILARVGGFELVGFTDAEQARWGGEFMGYPIIGGDAELPKLREQGVGSAFIGVGAVSSAGIRLRRRLFVDAVKFGFDLPSLVHDRAIVSASASVGSGSVIMGGAVVGAAVRVGDNVTIYSGAVVEHDSVLADHAQVSPGAQLAGTVSLGEGAFIGIGATVIQGVRIGAWATVGAGAVVVSNVPDSALVVGVPARVVTSAGGS